MMPKAPEQSFKLPRHLNALAKVMEMGLLVVGEDLELDFANAPAREALGCNRPEDLAERWIPLKESIRSALAATAEMRDAAGPLDLDIATGEKVCRLRLELAPLEEGEGYLILLHDRDQIDALETDLRLATRYRAMTSLYMSMAHDLKAPLNALTINLDLLKTILTRNAPTDPIMHERQQRYLKVLGDELARLNRSLQTFVSQTLPPNETRQEFNLRDLLLDLISLIAPQARKQQVALEVELDEQPLLLEGQRDLLKQALLNMAINALEAMPNGGRLRIKLETRLGQAIISLHDSGPGIPTDVAERIWEMHFTTKKTGTGIGLYVSRSVIESFGGSITVDASSGHGTCFVISLPTSNKEA